ncbi:MAG: carboxymuconolactone decarboxylase family protein [Flavobacteriales bacterium]|nr:carboxymuconolactone decarboxylase family protein [Flavobacteriales bacterium]
MKTLKALTPNQVDESTQEVFAAIKQKVGMVPNLYAAIGNSPALLKGFLAFSETLAGGVFTAKENEAIALAVSEINGCEYCLSAHSALGKMAGFSDNELVDIRKGIIEDNKLNALTELVAEITENRGKTSQAAIDNFLSVGYSHGALAELIGMVALRSFTNYIFNNGDFEIDFPKAPSLAELEVA